MLRSFGFLFLFFILIGIWLVLWLAFHIAGALIHLLLIVAVIAVKRVGPAMISRSTYIRALISEFPGFRVISAECR
jgi:putative effector of murein hydrolase LrgA (UPF0299 family)